MKNVGNLVKCKICKGNYDTLDEEAHLQYCELTVKLLICDVFLQGLNKLIEKIEATIT